MFLSRHWYSIVIAAVALPAFLFGSDAMAGSARASFVKATISREWYAPMLGVPPATPADVLMAGLNGSILEQYQDFTLVDIHVDQQQILTQRGAASHVAVVIREYFDTIEIAGLTLDARNGSGVLPEGQKADPPYAPGTKGMWLIQFMGPIRNEWIEAVEAEGITLVQYHRYHAYIAAGTEEAIRRASELRFIQWHMQMHRFLKTAWNDHERGTYVQIRVFLAKTDQTDAAVAVLAGLSRVPVRTWPSSRTVLNAVGVFQIQNVEYILSQPLVWAVALYPLEQDLRDVPATSDAGLLLAAVALSAAALLRLRSG